MKQEEVSVKAGAISVDLGIPFGGHVPPETALSMFSTGVACTSRGIPIGVKSCKGSSIVTDARNRVVHHFLKGNASRLFWIDADVQWDPNDFLKLLMMTVAVDVVCGAYPRKNEQADFVIGHPDLQNFRLHKYGLVKINGTGLGFCCVKREAIERLAETKPLIYDAVEGEWMHDIFRLDTCQDGEGRPCHRGEDVAFFSDLESLGYTIWLDPSIKLGHIGDKTYRGDPLEKLGLKEHFNQEAAQCLSATT